MAKTKIQTNQEEFRKEIEDIIDEAYVGDADFSRKEIYLDGHFKIKDLQRIIQAFNKHGALDVP